MSEPRNLTQPRLPIAIQIDHVDGTPDIFQGVPGLPAMSLIELASMFSSLSTEELISKPESIPTLVRLLLRDEDADRYLERMASRTDPIGFTELLDTVMSLMEAYGMRPTQPSEDSSGGSPSPASGTSSTASASPGASTPLTSLPTAS